MADDSRSPLTPVWLLSEDFLPRGSSLYSVRLARRLPALGFLPVIVCTDASRLPEDLRRDPEENEPETVAVYQVPRMRQPLFGAFALHTLCRQVKPAHRPRLVHAQRRMLADAARQAATFFHCRFVVTVHDQPEPGEALPPVTPELGAILAVSPSVHRDLSVRGQYPEGMVHVSPPGVDVSDRIRLPAPRPTDRAAVVGLASALEPSKGGMFFLLAAEAVVGSGHDVEFLVAGSGPDEDDLRRAAQRLKIAERVTFATHVPAYGPVIDSMDVFVMPALTQGLGTIMLEALAAGKAVVATRVGGIADYLEDGVHALLVPPGDHFALAEAIVHLLDRPDEARALAIAGRQLVRERFTADDMAERVADLYDGLLAATTSAS